MPLVMLRRNWPANFRRTVKTDDGRSRVLEFAPGEMHHVEPGELASIADDLGKALQGCQLDAKGRAKPADLTYEELVGQAVAEAEPESLAPTDSPPAFGLEPPTLNPPAPPAPESPDASNPRGRSRGRR